MNIKPTLFLFLTVSYYSERKKGQKIILVLRKWKKSVEIGKILLVK